MKLPPHPTAASKDDIKRQSPTRPLPEKIVTLRGTDLGDECEHVYVAEAPLKSGLNPLLLVIKSSNGNSAFKRVLAVLPDWQIQSDVCDSELYKAALASVQAEYKTFITALRPANLGRTLPAEIVDGRHCGNSIPFWLARPLSALLDETSQTNISPELTSEVRELLALKTKNDFEDVRWNVFHLQTSTPNPKIDPDWFIFGNWDDWIARGLDSAGCFKEFARHHQKPANQNAFNSHLKYLGLRVPLKPGVKRRRKRNWRFEKALQEKIESP